MSYEDRMAFANMYYTTRGEQWLLSFAGLWMAGETVLRNSVLKKWALGWRCLSVVGLWTVYSKGLNYFFGAQYSPLMTATLRKYSHVAVSDQFELQDRKREFYQIDTAQYMDYTEDDLNIHGHENHGPQPDGEALDNTWLTELGKFLDNEPNNLKGHKKFDNNPGYVYLDKSFPSVEAADDLAT